MKTIAVIGLGSMGLGIATSLMRGGFPVRGFDTAIEPRNRLSSAGGLATQSAGEASENADAAVIVVINSAQTEDALFGEEGALSRLRPGSVVIACPTMAPKDARRISAAVTARGFPYLDAPISGGTKKALAGRLTIMASGTSEAFQLAEPMLGAIAEKVHKLGDEAGTGSSFKVINQLLAGVHIAAACEAITLAKCLGLDLDKVYEVITSSAGNSWMFQDRVPHILQGDYAPRSAVNIFTKDLGIIAEIGREAQFPMPIATTALQMFLMTTAAGMGCDDDASVARLIAKVTGLELPESAAKSLEV